MNRILVPTDFSQLSEKALTVAVEISRRTKAVIELLHVIEFNESRTFTASGEIMPSNSINDLYMIKTLEVAKRNFIKLTNDIRFVGIRFITKVKVGNIYHHLSESIVNEKPDLIVMGTKGASGLFKGIFNSTNSEEVVMSSECMVLTVKDNQQDFRIRNVVFATDFKDYNPLFIKNILELQDLFDFRLHIVYVNSFLEANIKNDEVLGDKEIFIRKFNIKNYEFHILDNFTQYTGIQDYADSIHADLIVINTHQRKGFWHWAGGLSEDLVNYCPLPILTCGTGR